ncbi:MAG: efflux RND transporter periplasmic adaptor subunit [Rhodothermales bacterium]|nr:efflux RND transporter periplasmic adaptor subunit [Rhodothermales bacterium]
MKKFIAIALVLIVTAGTIWYSTQAGTEVSTEYRYVQLERGDLESVVASTGNLEAVQTVQVGTQVSGIIEEIYVDFNDRVRRGQLLARIDTTLLVSAIRDAEATLRRNQAQLDFANTEYRRISGLYEKQFATQVELNQAQYDVDLAEANLESARISLERARRNLGYARVYSPINGVVIERNVEPGQTVAASMSTPQLFLIANDLSKLQILASVDESDIGLIAEGQDARFTVQAYDDAVFVGRVRQVRLQSAVTENVVTYTVVIDVDNADGRLLPGMTATVDFLIDHAEDILKVPNAALRFRPTENMMAQLRERFEAQRAERAAAEGGSSENESGSDRTGGNTDAATRGASGSPAPGGFGNGNSNVAMLWYFDENDQLQIARVRTGITDGSMTQVTGQNLQDGMQIIAGVSEVEVEGGISNPFSSDNNSGGRGSWSRGGGF